jgi:hypothetical protein
MSAPQTITERDAVLRERKAVIAAVEWVLREGWRLGGEHVDACSFARRLYPLPKVTRPRMLPDPHTTDTGAEGLEFSWSVRGGVLKLGHFFKGAWHWHPVEDQVRYSIAYPTAERVKVWADLFANPTEEVEDDGTEGTGGTP